MSALTATLGELAGLVQPPLRPLKRKKKAPCRQCARHEAAIAQLLREAETLRAHVRQLGGDPVNAPLSAKEIDRRWGRRRRKRWALEKKCLRCGGERDLSVSWCSVCRPKELARHEKRREKIGKKPCPLCGQPCGHTSKRCRRCNGRLLGRKSKGKPMPRHRP